MKRLLSFLAIVLAMWSACYAVPAKPGFSQYRQSDGTMVSIETVGDEFYHAFVTLDGMSVERNQQGDWVYATTEEVTQIIAHDPALRGAQEAAFVKAEKEALQATARMDESTRHLIRKVNGARKAGNVGYKGKKRIPILLVDYTDVKMKHSAEEFKAHYSSGPNSAYQYFYDQSNGKFQPQFDVWGVFTLSNNRAYYGAHGKNNQGSTVTDVRLGEMVAESITMAEEKTDINWKDYDNDNDGECDVVIVVYAGVGEAQASTTHPEAIWPCQWNLYSANYFGDGPGYRFYDNTLVDAFAVFNELNGNSDAGTKLDGVGTFVHEFSHALGLPDFYETTYNYGYYGMGYWSLMCAGSYNNNSDTPVGYSAYEKNFFGWIDLIEPEGNTKYTLTAMNQGDIATDQAVIIESDLNPNEFYILENRRKQGWDAYIADEGLLISHVTYVPSRWMANTVNNEQVQLMTIAPADNKLSRANETGDLWGNGKSDFTDSSTPAAKLFMTESGSVTGKAGYLGKPVTEITRNDDGTVSFWYMKGKESRAPEMLPVDSTSIDLTEFKAEWTYPGEEALVESYTLQVEEGKPVELLEEADFNQFLSISDGTRVSIYTDRDKYLPAGWDADSPLYLYYGRLVVGNSVNTKTYDLSKYDDVTIVLTGRCYSYGNASNFCVFVGDEISSDVYTYSAIYDNTVKIKLPCKDLSQAAITILGEKYPCFSKIRIYGGDATAPQKAKALAPVETGGDTTRTITGITSKSYVVKNLQAGDSFAYKVKAVFTDGRESEWSNTQFVQLAARKGTPGDVNEDGNVDVTDATVCINHILGIETTPFNAANADLDGNGEIDVTDVTMLILKVLVGA
ncbi:MAG: M6 family metalloprotease domain-containing protein [Bacteroidales bacterium]|nr:M6 family metalloprotease domain-containing protein [Bacteroidales bacterium]